VHGGGYTLFRIRIPTRLTKTSLVRACLLSPADVDVGSAAAEIPQMYIATGDGSRRQLATNHSAADTRQGGLTAVGGSVACAKVGILILNRV